MTVYWILDDKKKTGLRWLRLRLHAENNYQNNQTHDSKCNAGNYDSLASGRLLQNQANKRLLEKLADDFKGPGHYLALHGLVEMICRLLDVNNSRCNIGFDGIDHVALLVDDRRQIFEYFIYIMNVLLEVFDRLFALLELLKCDVAFGLDLSDIEVLTHGVGWVHGN
jgi:hypothetical protein